MVIDADGLNSIAGQRLDRQWPSAHPYAAPGRDVAPYRQGVEEIQSDRVAAARGFAAAVDVQVVLKGNRTLIATQDGEVLVNPTGSPAMATGGTGDVLTGLAAGMIAQCDGSPEQIRTALAAAVYVHGLSGEIGAKALGEQCLIATDLLRFLPQAIGEVRRHLATNEHE